MKHHALLLAAVLSGCGDAAEQAPAVADSGSPAADTAVVEDTAVAVLEDTAVVDASLDARPPCAVPGALLCEDFESGKIDGDVWTRELKNATMAVETGRAANGKFALHLRVQGPKTDMPNEAFLHERVTFPAEGNKFFGRAMVFFEKNLPDKNFVLIEATGMLPSGDGGRYGIGGANTADGQMFRLVYHPGDYRVLSTSHPPVGRWVCWEFSIDGSNNSERVWIDGRDMPEARAVDEKPAWIAPAFRDLAIGFRVPHTDSREAYDVWLDDIAISTVRPGCPK